LAYLEHSQTSGAGDGVSNVGVEMQRLAQRLGDSWRGYDGGERESVADSLGHGHNVRHDIMRFKSPERLARPAKTSLHLRKNQSFEKINFLLRPNLNISPRLKHRDLRWLGRFQTPS
jgi:hypothetical protein